MCWCIAQLGPALHGLAIEIESKRNEWALRWTMDDVGTSVPTIHPSLLVRFFSVCEKMKDFSVRVGAERYPERGLTPEGLCVSFCAGWIIYALGSSLRCDNGVAYHWSVRTWFVRCVRDWI